MKQVICPLGALGNCVRNIGPLTLCPHAYKHDPRIEFGNCHKQRRRRKAAHPCPLCVEVPE